MKVLMIGTGGVGGAAAVVASKKRSKWGMAGIDGAGKQNLGKS